jgi:hypothetical protein
MADNPPDDKPNNEKQSYPYGNPYDYPPFGSPYGYGPYGGKPPGPAGSDGNNNYYGEKYNDIVDGKIKEKEHDLENYKEKSIFNAEHGLKGLGINTGIFAGLGLLAGGAFGAMAGKGAKGKFGKCAGYGALGAALFGGVGLLMGR